MEGGSQTSFQSSENGNLANPARGDWVTGVDSIVRTELKYSHYKFIWEVPKFCEAIYRGSRILSPTFVDPKTNHTWSLFVDPKQRVEGTDYVGVGLKLQEYGTRDESLHNKLVNIHYAIRVLDENLGSIQNGETEGMHSFKRSEAVRQQKLLVTNEILKGRLLPNGILCLLITIKTELGVTHSLVKNDPELTPPLTQAESVAAVKRPNVILIAQGEQFPAHREVLEGRSGTFRDLFADNDDAIEITIPDYCAPVVDAFLAYIYQDNVPFAVLLAHAPEIRHMAIWYRVDGLKKLCEDFMKWASHFLTRMMIYNQMV